MTDMKGEVTPEHYRLAQNARDVAKSLAAIAGLMDDRTTAKRIYEAVKTITALADLYDKTIAERQKTISEIERTSKARGEP